VGRAGLNARWTREDWLAFGEDQLKTGGPGALALDRICAAAGRTKGSFYHHFASTDAYLAALVERWREWATDRIAEAALSSRDPEASGRTLRKLTAAMDHRLDLAIREAAAPTAELAAKVAEADSRREAVVGQLIAAAYGVDVPTAQAAARIFHAVHLAGQIRAPQDVAAFTAGPYGLLHAWLERERRA
jgi:AcrR family transcriptional regulator